MWVSTFKYYSSKFVNICSAKAHFNFKNNVTSAKLPLLTDYSSLYEISLKIIYFKAFATELAYRPKIVTLI